MVTMTDRLVQFIIARDAVRVAKERGKPPPWTDDPILAKYRFCNVHREDDRVTKWLRTEWYARLAPHEDIWFSAIVARLFNSPESLEAIIGYTLPWKPEKVRSILHSRKRLGKKNFNAAYIVSTNGIAMDKIDYVIYKVLGLLWSERKKMRPTKEDTLEVYHDILTSFDGLGSFLAAQVVADLKYMEPLRSAEDWWTFAASGPGSRRGLNRVLGFAVDSTMPEAGWRAHLDDLLTKVNAKLPERFHAQDLQNCLCEFDKYERARLGEGTPKQIYRERN